METYTHIEIAKILSLNHTLRKKIIIPLTLNLMGFIPIKHTDEGINNNIEYLFNKQINDLLTTTLYNFYIGVQTKNQIINNIYDYIKSSRGKDESKKNEISHSYNNNINNEWDIIIMFLKGYKNKSLNYNSFNELQKNNFKLWFATICKIHALIYCNNEYYIESLVSTINNDLFNENIIKIIKRNKIEFCSYPDNCCNELTNGNYTNYRGVIFNNPLYNPELGEIIIISTISGYDDNIDMSILDRALEEKRKEVSNNNIDSNVTLNMIGGNYYYYKYIKYKTKYLKLRK